ncbi:hypothetical protein Aspvir_008440 [Aspergillus viridinutans]|uniref:Uncharacterized protein n=1 Tax=Aspergillus viridinutans TaxID=75553 RepID=A0A9P3C5P7_ASPVI|nr:uncharacterized protein Aspvir_008440 [Aspergillus viridinutans]GIK04359.1 hypothetical protein Aspvir_008440 [Aspergillus viridinutans]
MMKFPTITAAILSSAFLASPGVIADTLKYNREYDYAQNTALTLFSCSDGANGLMTRYGVNNLQQLRNKLQPNTYVGASSAVAKWNDPNCGKCFRATNPSNNKSLSFVVIEQNSAVVTGEEGFCLLSPSGTTSEGTLTVDIAELPSQSCWK